MVLAAGNAASIVEAIMLSDSIHRRTVPQIQHIISRGALVVLGPELNFPILNMLAPSLLFLMWPFQDKAKVSKSQMSDVFRVEWNRVSEELWCVRVIVQKKCLLLFNRAKLCWRMEVCPGLKHDISQLAAEVLEQVLDGNNGGMERGGGIGEGWGGGWRCGTAERRVVQQDGAAAKMSVQVSLFIVPPYHGPLRRALITTTTLPHFPSPHIQEHI